MQLKVAGKALKRGFRFFRVDNQKKTLSNNIFETIAMGKLGGGEGVVLYPEEDGAVKMKIVVKKSHLKQIVEMMISDSTGEAYRPPSETYSSVEQQLSLLWKKHHAARRNCLQKSWSPALQSIPEEL